MENTPESFYNFLIDNGFIISKINAKIIWMGMFITSPKAFIFEGPAGTGKTKITELMDEYIKIVKGHCEYLFFQCVYGTDENEIIYKIIPTGGGFETIPGVLPSALECSKTTPTVVVLDEFDKTRVSSDALLLDYIQNGRVSMVGRDSKTLWGNLDNLIIVLTSNAFREFSDPLLRRCIVVHFSQLSPSDVKNTLSYHFDDQMSELLTNIYTNTINAELEKPATIQELIQLGSVLQYEYTDYEFRQYLRAYILKTQRDYEKYFDSIGHTIEDEKHEPLHEEDNRIINLIEDMPLSFSDKDFTYVDLHKIRSFDDDDYGSCIDFNNETLTTLGNIYPPGSNSNEIGDFKIIKYDEDDGTRNYYALKSSPVTMDDLVFRDHVYDTGIIRRSRNFLSELHNISRYIKWIYIKDKIILGLDDRVLSLPALTDGFRKIGVNLIYYQFDTIRYYHPSDVDVVLTLDREIAPGIYMYLMEVMIAPLWNKTGDHTTTLHELDSTFSSLFMESYNQFMYYCCDNEEFINDNGEYHDIYLQMLELKNRLKHE